MGNLADLSLPAADAITTTGTWDEVPPGIYSVFVLGSKVEEMRSGNGQKLTVDIQIAEGDQRGRRLWPSFNLWHRSSPEAVTIAKNQFSSLVVSCGLNPENIRDTSELYNKFCRAVVVHRPDRNGQARAEVQRWLPPEEGFLRPQAASVERTDDIPF